MADPDNRRNFTGENIVHSHPEILGVVDYANKIIAVWTRTVDSILETARLCAEANRLLGHDEKAMLMKSLPFKAPTFSKLAKIGADERLRTDSIRRLLPPCYSIMYAVSHLSQWQLERAIETGTLKPSMRRTEVERFKRANPPVNLIQACIDEDSPSTPRNARWRVLGTIQVAGDYPEERLAELEETLKSIEVTFDVTFVKRVSRDERAMDAYGKKIDRVFRVLVRRRIRELRAKQLLGKEHLSPALKKKHWGFADDEIFIWENFSGDEIRGVLDFLGIGDETDEIYMRAIDSVEPPSIEPPDYREDNGTVTILRPMSPGARLNCQATPAVGDCL